MAGCWSMSCCAVDLESRWNLGNLLPGIKILENLAACAQEKGDLLLALFETNPHVAGDFSSEAVL